MSSIDRHRAAAFVFAGAVAAASPAMAAGNVFPLRSSGTLTGGSAERSRLIDPGNGQPYIDTAGSGGMGGISFSYDSVSGRYTVKTLARGLTYTTTSRPSSSGYYDVYKTNTTKATDTLKLYGNVRRSGTGLPIKLSYVSFGYWQHIDKATKANQEYFFFFGSPTPTSGVPKTGSATYKTFLTGNSVVTGYGGGNYEVSGTAAFSANFGTGTVSTQLNLTRPTSTGAVATIGTYKGTASISVGTFSGLLTSTDKYLYAGGFSGAFFGPAAEEVGYNFSVYRVNPDPYGGAAPQFSTEHVMGVVVGTRN